MTATTDKIQYRIATKDMILGDEFVILKKGMLVKMEEKDNGTFVFVNHPRGYGGFSSEEEMKMYTRKAKKKDIKRIKKQFINKEAEFSLRKINEYQVEVIQAIEGLFNTVIDEKTMPAEFETFYIDDLITFTENCFKDYVEYANMKPKELETDTVLYLQ